MICKNCGAKLPDNTGRCDVCLTETDLPMQPPIASDVMKGPPRYSERRRPHRQHAGPGVLTIVLILIVALAFLFGLFYISPFYDMVFSPSVLSSNDPALETSSYEEPDRGIQIGTVDNTTVTLADDTTFYLVDSHTGEEMLLYESPSFVVDAAVHANYVYYIESQDSANYLNRIKIEADASPEKLRMSGETQRSTQLVRLYEVDEKLCGFARYAASGSSAAYVELYKLNDDGIYSPSDNTTAILYTLQMSDDHPMLSDFSAEKTDSGIDILLNGNVIESCIIS